MSRRIMSPRIAPGITLNTIEVRFHDGSLPEIVLKGRVETSRRGDAAGATIVTQAWTLEAEAFVKSMRTVFGGHALAESKG